MLQSTRNLLLGDLDLLTIEQKTFALMRAVSICSRTWQQNQKPDKWLTLWAWRIRKMDIDAELKAFLAYVAAGSTFPIMNKKTGGVGGGPGAPFIAACVLFAFSLAGPQAYDMPLGWVHWLYMTKAEQDGSASIENDSDQAVAAEIEKLKAERAAEAKAAEQQQPKEDSCPA